MQANPSSRWKNDILPVIGEHDFGLIDVYDAGPGFRQNDDDTCDFCGTHLRYTAVIGAEDDPDIEYEVGLDCLEHAMGTKWSHMQDVERRIKELKEEARKERRKEAFAEEYEEEIEWLETRLGIIDDNDFLRSMHNVLTTGEKEFSKRMHRCVLDAMEETDLDALRRKAEKLGEWKERVDQLIELIVETDDLEWDEDRERYVGNSSGYSFVKSVRRQMDNRGFISEAQMEALNDVFQRYQDKQEETAQEEAPAVPF